MLISHNLLVSAISCNLLLTPGGHQASSPACCEPKQSIGIKTNTAPPPSGNAAVVILERITIDPAIGSPRSNLCRYATPKSIQLQAL